MPDAVFAESERRGEFTAERLFKRRPDTYKAIVQLLAEGRGQIWIGELLSVSPSTVRAVAKREGSTVGIAKASLAAEAFGAAQLATEVLHQKLQDPKVVKELHPLDAAKISGIMADKALVLAGEANVIIETKAPPAPEHDDFNSYLQSLKTVGTGLVAEKSAAIEIQASLRPAAPGAQGVDADVVPNSDAESEGRPNQTPANPSETL